MSVRTSSLVKETRAKFNVKTRSGQYSYLTLDSTSRMKDIAEKVTISHQPSMKVWMDEYGYQEIDQDSFWTEEC